MKISTKNKIDAAFSMASMTDIIFLLLIFLLITTNHTPKAIPVDLPLSTNEKTASAQVNVTVTAKLQYYVEKQQIPFEQLQITLQNQLEKTASKMVVLHIDKRLSIAHMVKVADIAHTLGAAISIATECKKDTMKHSWLCTNKQGIIASIGLHLFFLGLVYFIQLSSGSGTSNGQAYTIALTPASPCSTPKPPLEAHIATHKPSKKIANHSRKVQPRQLKKAPSGSAKVTQKAIPCHEVPAIDKIDKRGLYNIGKDHTKQTGVTLELTGWTWDTIPNPKDTSEECGKIIFEIKIDENGEIISIQTIEKTVAPIIEKIYSDALRGLTFSKTSESQPYSQVSTGKVTFLLVAN